MPASTRWDRSPRSTWRAGRPPQRGRALNTALPDDLSVTAASEAAAGFDARHSARSRTYRYRIWRRRTPSPFERRRSWWLPRPIEESKLAESADLILGEHDFRVFNADRDATPRLPARGEERRVAPSRRRTRARDHGRQLPPAHGADPGRDDDREGAEGDRPARRPPALGGGFTAPPRGLYLVSVQY